MTTTLDLLPYQGSWVEKYRPKKLEEVVGNPTAIRRLKNWFKDWNPRNIVFFSPKAVSLSKDEIKGLEEDLGEALKTPIDVKVSGSELRVDAGFSSLKKLNSALKKILRKQKWKGSIKAPLKAILLVGPPGSGKTSSVHALAAEENLDLIEFNASDTRNRQKIQQLLTTVSSRPLVKGKSQRILLVDEVDGISGNEDQGGVAALIDLFSRSRIPIVLTANKSFSRNLRTLYSKCKKVKFGKIRADTVTRILQTISKKEGILVPLQVITALSKNSEGDLRAAINDLQNLAGMDIQVSTEAITSLRQRDSEIDIFEALRVIFSEENPFDALLKTKQIEDVDYRLLLAWVSENAFQWAETPQELRNIYDAVARADRYLGSIKMEHWKLLKHFYFEITAGVNFSKKTPYRFRRASFPRTFFQRRGSKIPLNLSRIAPLFHCSQAKFVEFIYPQLPFIFSNNAQMAAEIALYLDLTDDEIKSLAGRRTRGVKKLRDTLKKEIRLHTKELDKELKEIRFKGSEQKPTKGTKDPEPPIKLEDSTPDEKKVHSKDSVSSEHLREEEEQVPQRKNGRSQTSLDRFFE